ncbi:cytochrome P450 [Nocardia sp. alder85J]|uniref:cytochrome P450 n=1 Tax=Nocardia sp. alder85J TaxID=2862949 RepID=UPI001CD455BA|nr:cytochrome P450 [Nocardia sp. alder85J]MCX4091573.1 cytochrome P450 [Nocardia sp. alder85J]
MSAETEVVFDGFHPAFRANPYPRYAIVREVTPLYALRPDVHLATRYAEVSAVLTDPDWGHGYDDGINPLRPGVAPEEVPGGIVRMDPPQHTRVRAIVSRAFTPRRVEEITARVEQRVDELLDAAIPAGEVDLVETYARPAPFAIIAEMLGVPVEDYREVMAWSLALVHGTDPDILQTPAQLARRDAARVEFDAYFVELIAMRHKEPRDDMFTDMAAARDAGTATDSELAGLCTALMVGGYETAADVIGTGIVALLRNPDQLALWRERPELARSGVEELLRYEPPVQFTHRVALTERQLAGRTFPRGSGVVVAMAGANRDPAVYTDPDRLDITRFESGTPPPRPLSFGGGVHFCLGSTLGKLEVRLAVDTLLRRAPELALAGAPVWRDTAAFHGLDALPVRLRA